MGESFVRGRNATLDGIGVSGDRPVHTCCRDHLQASISRCAGAGSWALPCVSRWLTWTSLTALVRIGVRVLV